MNSFKLTAVGNLARNPELSVRGLATFARFRLVGYDNPVEDDTSGHKHGTVSSLWFFAFGDIATDIARKARKGAQLFLEARVIANDWTRGGEKKQGVTFIVTGFRFGAKRGDPGAPAVSCQCMPPDAPQPQPAQAEAAVGE